MKTLEEIKAMRDELADRRSKWQSSSGCELMDAAIRRLIRISYEDGFDAAIELMLEREREIAEKTLDAVSEEARKIYEEEIDSDPSDYFYTRQAIQNVSHKLIKGEK